MTRLDSTSRPTASRTAGVRSPGSSAGLHAALAFVVVAAAAPAAFGQDAPAPAPAPAPAQPAEEAKPEAAPPADPAPAPAAPDAAAEPADEGASVSDPTEAPAEAASGSITVSSNPPGKVFIDGADTGLETPLIDHEVAPGTHTLKVVDEASGRFKEVTFHLEAGAVLNLNLNLPQAEPAATDPVAASTQPAAEEATEVATAVPVVDDGDDWTWMTVAGWMALGLGTLGLLAGAVILTTPTDPNQGPLGFGLFGAGAGFVLGGGVLLYLDSELADTRTADASDAMDGDGEDPAEEGAPDEEKELDEDKRAWLPLRPSVALSE